MYNIQDELSNDLNQRLVPERGGNDIKANDADPGDNDKLQTPTFITAVSVPSESKTDEMEDEDPVRLYQKIFEINNELQDIQFIINSLAERARYIQFNINSLAVLSQYIHLYKYLLQQYQSQISQYSMVEQQISFYELRYKQLQNEMEEWLNTRNAAISIMHQYFQQRQLFLINELNRAIWSNNINQQKKWTEIIQINQQQCKFQINRLKLHIQETIDNEQSVNNFAEATSIVTPPNKPNGDQSESNNNVQHQLPTNIEHILESTAVSSAKTQLLHDNDNEDEELNDNDNEETYPVPSYLSMTITHSSFATTQQQQPQTLPEFAKYIVNNVDTAKQMSFFDDCYQTYNEKNRPSWSGWSGWALIEMHIHVNTNKTIKTGIRNEKGMSKWCNIGRYDDNGYNGTAFYQFITRTILKRIRDRVFMKNK